MGPSCQLPTCDMVQYSNMHACVLAAKASVKKIPNPRRTAEARHQSIEHDDRTGDAEPIGFADFPSLGHLLHPFAHPSGQRCKVASCCSTLGKLLQACGLLW